MKKLYQKISLSHCAFLSIFILGMFFSTSIILSARNLFIFEIEPINKHEVKIANTDVTYSIYYTTISDNIDCEVEIAGYAYIETEEDNQNKKVDIILQSEEHTYCMPTKLSFRHEWSAESTKKKDSFSGKFSSILLPDGIYDVILYCYENDTANGYINIGKRYKKEGRNFTPTVLPSFDSISLLQSNSNNVDLTRVNDMSTKPLPWHYIGLEKNDDDTEHIHLTGWIAVPSLDSKTASSFVALTDVNNVTKVFSTTKYESSKLEKSFGSSLGNHGFFDAYIPLCYLQPGEYVLQLIVQYPEATCRPEIDHRLIVSENKKVTFFSGFDKT